MKMKDLMFIAILIVLSFIAVFSLFERNRTIQSLSIIESCDRARENKIAEELKNLKDDNEIKNGVKELLSGFDDLTKTYDHLLKRIDMKSRNIFIDLGANKGDSIRSFTESEDAQGGNSVKERGRNGGWEIFAFEANPIFDEKLINLGNEINKAGLNSIKIFNSTAISTENGWVEFYLDTVNEKQDYWGSSLISNHPDVVASGNLRISVKSVDIHSFIINNFSRNDYIIIKMDIEGYEFQLFRHMFVKGTIDFIDEIYVEFHDRLGFEGSEHLGAIKWIMGISDVIFVTNWN